MAETLRITLLTYGSRGDVAPMVALGHGMHRAGHRVRIAAPPQFAPLVERTGIEHHPVAADIRDVIGTALGQPPVGPTPAYFRFMTHAHTSIRRVYGASLDPWWAASEDADALVFAASAPAGYDIARERGIPCAMVALQPIVPTRVFAVPGAPTLPLGGTYNYLTYHAAEQGAWRLLSEPTNAWRRRTLRRPPWPWHGPYADLRARGTPTLMPISPAVVLPPKDWGAAVHPVGYWFDDHPYTPPPALVRFLDAGPPPVYVGFGSMADADPLVMTRLVAAALRQVGQRGVLLRGWGGLVDGEWGDDMLMIDEVSHRWLLPRVVAAVHHGGAGTVAAVLRVGVPSATVPFLSADQRFWGERIAALDAGVGPISRKRLTASRLAAAIATITHDATMRERAQAIGRQIETEDGVGTAVAILERVFARSPGSG